MYFVQLGYRPMPIILCVVGGLVGGGGQKVFENTTRNLWAPPKPCEIQLIQMISLFFTSRLYIVFYDIRLFVK